MADLGGARLLCNDLNDECDWNFLGYVDDVRVSNPPVNPELYRELGRKLVEYKYDFRKLVRDICASNTYQRSGERNTRRSDGSLRSSRKR
jgi:hypothetical protein